MKLKKLLAIFLALLLLTTALAGCGATAKSEAAYDTAGGQSNSYVADKPMETPAEEPAMPAPEMAETEESYVSTQSYSDMETGEAPDADSVTETADFAAKIIYSANLMLQTTEFDQSVAALEKTVASFGGFVERSDAYGDIRYNDDGSTQVVNRYAYYTVRVPAARFEEFLQLTDGFGNVLNSSRYAENVTSQYTDYEARLDSLYTQEERLLSMLEKSEDVESLIALEERLADVRYEIESIERNLRNLDMQIGYSTIEITLEEVEVYTPTTTVQRTFGEKVSDAFTDGWKRFVRRSQNFFVELVYSLPGLILFLIVAGLAVFFGIKLRRKAKAKKAAKEAAREAAKQPENDPPK